MQLINMDVNEQVKKLEGNVRTSAHNVWLASLGAVSLAEEEGRDLLENLIARGRTFEGRGRKEVDKAVREMDKARGRVTKGVEDLAELVDRRVAAVLHRMGIPTRDEIQTLTRRVEELTHRVLTRGEKVAATAERKVYHVVWADEQWKVEAEGASRATSTHATKDEAVSAARELAQGQVPSQMVIHRMDGTVQTQTTYDEPLVS